MTNIETLRQTLSRIDKRGYKAYKDITGSYESNGYHLFIDHVQGDPFAEPSKIRVRVLKDVAKIPDYLFSNPVRQMAIENFLGRKVSDAIKKVVHGRRGSGKSGLISIDSSGQEVLKRTSLVITPDWVEARMEVGLPAQGRSVLGKQAELMLCEELTQIVKHSLLWKNLKEDECEHFVFCIENQEGIRNQLDSLGLVAFVANGSILPRKSGISDLPLQGEQVIKFQSPSSWEVSLILINPIKQLNGLQEKITGMGVRKGVTLIVGGGYHGKSTLLKALERCVYPHLPKDGREYVITNHDAFKIRAEDGRRIERVDISPFINNLPFGQETKTFSSDDASGSTSQASNIIEAIESGSTTLLLDEDTSATNFMVRDARMQELVNKQHEPITPFLDRVHELYTIQGISTILVMGGCGDYFDVADNVVMMREFTPMDVTKEAKSVANKHNSKRNIETQPINLIKSSRRPLASSFDASKGKRDVKIGAKGLDTIMFGGEDIDVRYVEQLVDISQSRAVAFAIYLAATKFMQPEKTLRETINQIEEFLESNGLDNLNPHQCNAHHPGNFARPRKHEIAAAINRLRSMKMKQ